MLISMRCRITIIRHGLPDTPILSKLSGMIFALRSGALYFAIIFAVAFVLGVFRSLVVAPVLGEVLSVALELVPMILLSWFVCDYVLRHWPVPRALPQRAAMGTAAFILLMLAEAAISLLLGGITIQQHLALFTTPPVQLGLVGQLLFALFPVIRR